MQRLKEEVKQKIIEVGKIRFKKDGYDNTSMKDIASDAGISTGNIYRYFLTKKHLLNEILKEIEDEIQEFFEKIPSDYENVNLHNSFELIIDLTLKIAKENNDTLKVMFNCQNESQFISFKERILNLFTQKMIDIVKTNIDDVDLLKKNLKFMKN